MTSTKSTKSYLKDPALSPHELWITTLVLLLGAFGFYFLISLMVEPAPEITVDYCSSHSISLSGYVRLPDCYIKFPEKFCPEAVGHARVSDLLAVCLKYIPK